MLIPLGQYPKFTYNHYSLYLSQPLIPSLSIIPLDKLIPNQIGIAMYKSCNDLHSDVTNIIVSEKEY